MRTKTDIIELKEEIDEAKSRLSKLKGKMEHIMKELDDDWECDSIKAAQELAESEMDGAEKIEKRKVKMINELEDKYKL